jgi:hypothetical protein
MGWKRIVVKTVALATCGCAGARAAPTPTAGVTPSSTIAATATSTTVTATLDASVQNASIDAGVSTPEASAPIQVPSDAKPDAGSPLATLFDGDPTGGSIALADARCGPGCLQYPTGWIGMDDSGFVYAWFLVGEGQFSTTQVTRCPVAELDDAALATRLPYAGGDDVTWAAPIDGTVGKDHAHARIAEGRGKSHGRSARFWYAHVDVANRKDLVIAYVVDGAPQERFDEMIAVVRSLRTRDGTLPSTP